MSWWETLHLVTWWKRLGISAIKTGQDAPSWIWCTERLSFFGGGHIVLQRFVHVRCHFQPLPTKLVFAYFDRGSYVTTKALMVTTFWIETAQLSGWQVQLAMCHEPGWTSVPVREVPGSSLGSYFLEAAYDNLNPYFPHQRAMSTMGLFTCQTGDSNFLAFHGGLHETMVQNLYHKCQMAGKFRIMSKYQIIFWNRISFSPV